MSIRLFIHSYPLLLSTVIEWFITIFRVFHSSDPYYNMIFHYWYSDYDRYYNNGLITPSHLLTMIYNMHHSTTYYNNGSFFSDNGLISDYPFLSIYLEYQIIIDYPLLLLSTVFFSGHHYSPYMCILFRDYDSLLTIECE